VDYIVQWESAKHVLKSETFVYGKVHKASDATEMYIVLRIPPLCATPMIQHVSGHNIVHYIVRKYLT